MNPTNAARPSGERAGTPVALTPTSLQNVIPGLAITALSAIWATWAGVLPGRGMPVLGSMFQGVLWGCLYAGLGLKYRAAAPTNKESLPRVFRRLGLGLPLALLATYGIKLLLEGVGGPSLWTDLFYCRWLLPPLLIGLWCAALLPRETRALLRGARANPRGSAWLQLVLFLVAAALLVSCSDLAFIFQEGGGGVQLRLHGDEIRPGAWVTNVLLLFSAYALVLVITRRSISALLLVSPLYAVFAVATLAKIKYMHSAVQPLDLLRLPEFLPLFRSFFGTGAVVAGVVGLAVWMSAFVAIRGKQRSPLPMPVRWCIGLVSGMILMAVPPAVVVARSSPSIAQLLRFAGIPMGQRREEARRHGMLLSFLSAVPWAFVARPPNYSPTAVASTLQKYWRPGTLASERDPQPRVNLILYLVESLMDPTDLGIRYTADPIPNLRALLARHSSGYAVVPGRFGGSANTEFETLTGMASAFLPEGSVPYRQYVRQPIPSLPRALKDLGYATTAIQADPKYWYNRERVYDLLGFDRVSWLRRTVDFEPAARGDWPSDQSIVRAIIRASQVAQPFFIFAFPSSTHGPFSFGAYRGSDLQVLDTVSAGAAGEVGEYINALRSADDAIGTLIEFFSQRPEPTIIAVLGDHLPPLSESALQPFFRNAKAKSKLAEARLTHRVPLLVWSNFDPTRTREELSVNALPSYLLEKMGIVPSGFLAVTNAVRLELPVLGSYVQAADGSLWDRDSVPAQKQGLIDDYRLIQYDLLLGGQYSLGDTVPQMRNRVPPQRR